MHDPSILAFEIPAPWVRFRKWGPPKPRWGVIVHRRTNAENLGQRVYPWYRLKGYDVHAAGRRIELATLIEVWHDDPGGDFKATCKDLHPRGIRWTVKHCKHLRWKLMPWVQLRRRWERCDECKRRMRGAVRFGTGWDAPGVMHYECSNLRRVSAQRMVLLRHIAGVASETESWNAKYQVDCWLGMSNLESTL